MSVRSLVSVTLLILFVFAIFTVPSFRHELLNLISDLLGSLQTLVNSWRGA